MISRYRNVDPNVVNFSLAERSKPESTQLSPDEIRTLIDGARQRFAEERWPMSPTLGPMRKILVKLRAKPEPPLQRV